MAINRLSTLNWWIHDAEDDIVSWILEDLDHIALLPEICDIPHNVNLKTLRICLETNLTDGLPNEDLPVGTIDPRD